MKKTKSNLLISSVALVATMLISLYMIINKPENIELIIVFSLIAIVNSYFLVDGILKKIDDIANMTFDKQSELTKVEKGIYSVAKREEINMNERFTSLLNMIEALQEDNQRLNEELINQEKLCAKIIMKKNQENINKSVISTDRVAKLLVQLSNDNKDFSEETLDLLRDMSTHYDNDNDNDVEVSNVHVMTPRA